MRRHVARPDLAKLGVTMYAEPPQLGAGRKVPHVGRNLANQPVFHQADGVGGSVK